MSPSQSAFPGSKICQKRRLLPGVPPTKQRADSGRAESHNQAMQLLRCLALRSWWAGNRCLRTSPKRLAYAHQYGKPNVSRRSGCRRSSERRAESDPACSGRIAEGSYDRTRRASTLARNEVFRRPAAGTAEVCNQKAEVVEGAGEGAESSPTDFYKDLECFYLPSVPIVSMCYDQKHFVTVEARSDNPESHGLDPDVLPALIMQG
jgi:hypothetical protein